MKYNIQHQFNSIFVILIPISNYMSNNIYIFQTKIVHSKVESI